MLVPPMCPMKANADGMSGKDGELVSAPEKLEDTKKDVALKTQELETISEKSLDLKVSYRSTTVSTVSSFKHRFGAVPLKTGASPWLEPRSICGFFSDSHVR